MNNPGASNSQKKKEPCVCEASWSSTLPLIITLLAGGLAKEITVLARQGSTCPVIPALWEVKGRKIPSSSAVGVTQ